MFQISGEMWFGFTIVNGIVTCHQVFRNASQVGCWFGRWRVFFKWDIRGNATVCRGTIWNEVFWKWSRFLLYFEAEFWIFEFFELMKILILQKKWRPNKVDPTVPRGRRRPKKLEISAWFGLVFDELSVVQTVSRLAPINKHRNHVPKTRNFDECRSMRHNSGPDAWKVTKF
jgi:hypothetical protein